MFEDEYRLEFFRSRGYARRVCKICGKPFWSTGGDVCNEAPCTEYTFIGNPVMNKRLGIHDMRELILSYFERNNHTRISRYPIVARWREDVFFTQASIYDFQPRVTAGEDDPPANPLVVSQTCVRFNDIDNVGRTGRHLTMFEMIGHHVFNSPQKFVYWKEEAVAYCHNFLTREVGIPEEEIIYKEKPWFGGGNAGPSLEVIVRGLELATLVFMNLKESAGGDIILDDGKSYSRMAMQVVDPGWGLERFTWMSLASPSAYEAIFGDVLETLKGEAKASSDPQILSEYSRVAGMMNIETSADVRKLRENVAKRLGISVQKLEDEIVPMENLYIICDHSRALMFILNDGVVPSNVKEGYYARLLVRRTLEAIKKLDLSLPLKTVVSEQIKYFGNDFPELLENKDDILKIVDWEEQAYASSRKKTEPLVRKIEAEKIRRGESAWKPEELRFLYGTYGTTVGTLQTITGIKIPGDFDPRLDKSPEKNEETEHIAEKELAMDLPANLPPTQLEFYADERKMEFTAQVVYAGKNIVALEKTYFYPEGGGEESDTGTIEGETVKKAVRTGNIVAHIIENMPNASNKFAAGKTVHCIIDWERRTRLTAHHTATHIINGAARETLGNHVWQAGAHKGAQGARLDITHYRGLSKEETAKIEERANEIVKLGWKVTKGFVERAVAEKKYGFRLYQGGAVPGKMLRIVNINDWDVEACGGTHADSTEQVGLIKITGTKRIQDGVVRLEFVAGEAAKKYIADSEHKKTLEKVEKKLKMPPAEFERRANLLIEKAEIVSDIKVASEITEEEIPVIVGMARSVTKKGGVAIVLGTKHHEKPTIIVAHSGGPALEMVDAAQILKNVLPHINGAGGGRKDFAQGGGNRVDGLKKAVEEAAGEIKKRLRETANP